MYACKCLVFCCTIKFNSYEKNSSIILIIVAFLGCSKSTTGPPDCHIVFKLRYLDKETNNDLGISNPIFLDSIKISMKSINGEVVKLKHIRSDSVNYIEFFVQPYDLCNEIHYTKEDEFIYFISYANNLDIDSIKVRTGKINSSPSLMYYLNDSLIDKMFLKDFNSSRIELPVIILKK